MHIIHSIPQNTLILARSFPIIAWLSHASPHWTSTARRPGPGTQQRQNTHSLSPPPHTHTTYLFNITINSAQPSLGMSTQSNTRTRVHMYTRARTHTRTHAHTHTHTHTSTHSRLLDWLLINPLHCFFGVVYVALDTNPSPEFDIILIFSLIQAHLHHAHFAPFLWRQHFEQTDHTALPITPHFTHARAHVRTHTHTHWPPHGK